mgnify:CR=1 FL=1
MFWVTGGTWPRLLMDHQIHFTSFLDTQLRFTFQLPLQLSVATGLVLANGKQVEIGFLRPKEGNSQGMLLCPQLPRLPLNPLPLLPSCCYLESECDSWCPSSLLDHAVILSMETTL